MCLHIEFGKRPCKYRAHLVVLLRGWRVCAPGGWRHPALASPRTLRFGIGCGQSASQCVCMKFIPCEKWFACMIFGAKWSFLQSWNSPQPTSVGFFSVFYVDPRLFLTRCAKNIAILPEFCTVLHVHFMKVRVLSSFSPLLDFSWNVCPAKWEFFWYIRLLCIPWKEFFANEWRPYLWKDVYFHLYLLPWI